MMIKARFRMMVSMEDADVERGIVGIKMIKAAIEEVHPEVAMVVQFGWF